MVSFSETSSACFTRPKARSRSSVFVSSSICECAFAISASSLSARLVTSSDSRECAFAASVSALDASNRFITPCSLSVNRTSSASFLSTASRSFSVFFFAALIFRLNCSPSSQALSFASRVAALASLTANSAASSLRSNSASALNALRVCFSFTPLRCSISLSRFASCASKSLITPNGPGTDRTRPFHTPQPRVPPPVCHERRRLAERIDTSVDPPGCAPHLCGRRGRGIFLGNFSRPKCQLFGVGKIGELAVRALTRLASPPHLACPSPARHRPLPRRAMRKRLASRPRRRRRRPWSALLS